MMAAPHSKSTDVAMVLAAKQKKRKVLCAGRLHRALTISATVWGRDILGGDGEDAEEEDLDGCTKCIPAHSYFERSHKRRQAKCVRFLTMARHFGLGALPCCSNNAVAADGSAADPAAKYIEPERKSSIGFSAVAMMEILVVRIRI